MTVTIVYTEPIFQSAILSFLKRTYFKRMLLPSILALALLLLAFWSGSPWLEAATVMLVLVIPGMFVLGYWLRTRESLRRFRLLDHGRMTMTVSETGVAIESAAGKSETPWNIYNDLWEFPETCLLFYSGPQFITLPTNQVSTDFIAYIRAHLPSKAAPDG